jgi:hypothetical protein
MWRSWPPADLSSRGSPLTIAVGFGGEGAPCGRGLLQGRHARHGERFCHTGGAERPAHRVGQLHVRLAVVRRPAAGLVTSALGGASSATRSAGRALPLWRSGQAQHL